MSSRGFSIENGDLIGRIVKCEGDNCGWAKVVGLRGNHVSIEYFISVKQRKAKFVSLRDLVIDRVPAAQTRCYVDDRQHDIWRVGRLGSFDPVDGTWEVLFAGGRIGRIHQEHLYVRSYLAAEDPVELLASYVVESPLLYEWRHPVSRMLLEQRAVTRSIGTLLATPVKLLPHQIEAVRRVLSDPMPRYLLADEVGLGKTIEAGLILRQLLLDDDEAAALVLVPDHLVGQWQRELQGRLCLSDELQEGRVEVLGYSDIGSCIGEQYSILIVDEAHHITAGSRTSDLFGRVAPLAHRAAKLLLLSATPILGNSGTFLGLLHLLDPAMYSLSDLPSFERRLELRREIGLVMLRLTEDKHHLPLKSALARLSELLPEDASLNTRVEGGMTFLKESVTMPERRAWIRSIRTHLSENYRVYRRIIRNRRQAIQPTPTPGRHFYAQLEFDAGEFSARVEEGLEEWRLWLDQQRFSPGSDSQVSEEQYADLLWAMLVASTSCLSVLHAAVRLRLGVESDIGSDLPERVRDSLVRAPVEESERRILRRLLAALGDMPFGGDCDRVGLVVDICKQLMSDRQGIKKAVIFTEYTSVAKRTAELLNRRLGKGSGGLLCQSMEANELNIQLRSFNQPGGLPFLVVDASGQEGLNLQVAAIAIHLDLPYSPNALEQRIGRLDRIGQEHQAVSRCLAGADLECLDPDGELGEPPKSMQEALLLVLKDGFGVFDESIATLQEFVDEQIPALARALLREGSQGLVNEVAPLRERIAEREQALAEQAMLDQQEIDEEALLIQQGAQAFEERGAQWTASFRTLVEQGLKFTRRGHENSPVISYHPHHRHTLLAPDVLLRFSQRLRGGSGVFKRQDAIAHPGVPLFRLGHGFVDTIGEIINWDERGRSFAMWRQVPQLPDYVEFPPMLVIRFDFIIEAEIAGLAKSLASQDLNVDLPALRRLADRFLPPMMRTIILVS